MHRRFAASLGPSIAAFRLAFADPGLRRLLFAWFAAHTGRMAFLVTTLVIAYDTGGAVAVGLMGLARFLTPVVVAPFAGLPTVRWRPEAVLRTANAARTAAVALAAVVVLADLPAIVLYLVVAMEAAAGAFNRPLHMALLPSMSRSPAQLVAANVASSAAEGLGTFVGPALASLLLVVAGGAGATLAVVAIFALGIASIARLHVPAIRPPDTSARAIVHHLKEGFGAAVRLPGPRIVIIDLGVQTFVRGLLTVLIVVAAIELLDMGGSGVGTLNAALGLGGLLGAIGAVALAGRSRLTPAFALALVGWGAPIAIIGLVVDPLIAILAMLAIGISNSFVDVSAFTLAQRMTPNSGRVAVMGLIDSVASGAVAVGGIVAPFLIEAVGIRGALVTTAVILPVAAALSWLVLRDLDESGAAGAHRMGLVRSDPLFAPLSLATMEHLAGCLESVTFEDGDWLMHEGEAGDTYFLLEQGEVEVSRGDQVVSTLGVGAGVGEIALLHDVPRTASVRAKGPVVALALERATFLDAVAGHDAAHGMALRRADQFLAADAAAADP